MKYFFIVLLLSCAMHTFAQTTKFTVPKKGKSNDHIMLQFGSDTWIGLPDSVKTKGFGRGGGVYGMINFPFKTNKNLSVALGAGIGSTHQFFDKWEVDISGSTQSLAFNNRAGKQYFKKYKVSAAYLEAPIELRWVSNPANIDKSFKIAIGAKVGTLISAVSKGKTLLDANGNTINDYTRKEKKRTYFNSTKVALLARVGWGHFSVHAQYQATTLFKENIAAGVNPLSIGLTISGL